MKKTALMATLLVFGASVVGCGASNSTSNSGNTTGAGGSQQQSITIAADTTFPPFESEDASGNVQGFDIDLIKKIAEIENLKVNEVKTMQFTGLIPALTSGQVDVAVAGMTIKKTRLQAVDFSNAYYKSGLSILVKSDSSITGMSDLKGKLVATKKGTSSVDLLKQNGIADSNIKQFDTIDAAYSALETGGADAVVFDNPVNINFKSGHSNTKIVGGLLTGEYYGIAVRKDANGLLAKINDGLKKMQDDGDYQKLFDKYLGGDKAGVVDGVKAPADVALDS